jgi:hypothetical protein
MDQEASAIIAALVASIQLEHPDAVPFAITQRKLDTAPLVRLSWNADHDRVTIHQLKPFDAKSLRWGDRARLACSATGRYLGEFDGKHLALFVSAMDNSLNVGEIDLTPTEGPHPTLPVPTDRELEAAANGLRAAGALRDLTTT